VFAAICAAKKNDPPACRLVAVFPVDRLAVAGWG